ncbi:REP-associated tyrosine transposase [Undibacterium sp. Ji50W]|uniref:REP-associated tyrosine transposase n=1 Tax=Undibacterium sp. Ji50W TaxID=3413041 RepID=UPI003BF1197F
MSNYRRAFVPGGTWFFTVNLLQRHGNDLLVREIDLLRQVVRNVRNKYPFHIDAWVVLPEHMHCIFTLPEGDSDFSLRWRLIKSSFSRALPKTELLSTVRQAAGERGIWQRHYWEHLIRDELDFQKHVDYVHVNPLKHGLVQRVCDWPYSTFHHYVDAGIYPLNWCGDVVADIAGGD